MTVYICTFCMLFYVVGSTFIQIEWKKLKLFEWQGNIDMIQNWFFLQTKISVTSKLILTFIIWALFCRVEKNTNEYKFYIIIIFLSKEQRLVENTYSYIWSISFSFSYIIMLLLYGKINFYYSHRVPNTCKMIMLIFIPFLTLLSCFMVSACYFLKRFYKEKTAWSFL